MEDTLKAQPFIQQGGPSYHASPATGACLTMGWAQQDAVHTTHGGGSCRDGCQGKAGILYPLLTSAGVSVLLRPRSAGAASEVSTPGLPLISSAGAAGIGCMVNLLRSTGEWVAACHCSGAAA